MKNLLLCSVAAVGVAVAAAPAMAQIDVTLGGHTKNYIGWLDQDTVAGAEERSFDMLRESELHFNAEGTADNGLTYGFHVEMEVDEGDESDTIEESYLYLSSGFGRLNLGSEDGANYLLQVAAPAGDDNIDGLRQYINPVNYALNGAGGVAAGNTMDDLLGNNEGLDYDNDATGQDEKITYLSPNYNGFQAGLSYTPETLDDNGSSTGLAGFNADDTLNNFGEGYEGALRYEGTFNNVGFALGGGYTHIEVEETNVASTVDDFNEWNLGADFDIGAFGVGAVYTENNNGLENQDSDQTIVLGVDYTTGPFKLGASYYTRDDEGPVATGEVETERYAGGVVYTAAPGLSFRGSIQFTQSEVPAALAGGDTDATAVLGGVQLNF